MPFDRRFLEPSVHELVDALIRARQSANRSSFRTLSVERETFVNWANRVREEPEGRKVWSTGRSYPASRVALNWWTDRIGRVHCRVQGGFVAGYGEEKNWERIRDNWPPLWHVRPENLVLRRMGGRHEFLAVCSCGACGLPEEIGWMGDVCGPCHDRREERPGQTDPPVALQYLNDHILRLAFSPDSRLLASADSRARVRCWDLTTGKDQLVLDQRDWQSIVNLEFTPDSSELLVCHASSTIRSVNLATLEKIRLARIENYAALLRVSPDGRYLAVAGSRNVLLNRLAPEAGMTPFAAGQELCDLRFSREGRELFALTSNGLILQVSVPDGGSSILHRLPMPDPIPLDVSQEEEDLFTRLARLGDYLLLVGEQMLVVRGGLARGDGTVQVWSSDRGWGPAWKTGQGGLSALAASPDGEIVATGGQDGSVILWQRSSRKSLVELSFDLLRVNALAFSPDGEKLAVANTGGAIRCWPWSRLL